MANLPAAIIPPVDLADGASVIVISVEPNLDGIDPTGPAPFSIKPLVGAVPAGLADHTFMAMDQDLSGVPTGGRCHRVIVPAGSGARRPATTGAVSTRTAAGWGCPG